MKWSDIPRKPTHRTLRQFAAAWLVFFLIWAAVLALGGGRTAASATFAIVAIVGGMAGMIHPSSLRWIFVGWMMLVFPIGWLISQLMLALLFYGLFTPIGFLLRRRGRDALRLKASPAKDSYWLPKNAPSGVRSYFRQY